VLASVQTVPVKDCALCDIARVAGTHAYKKQRRPHDQRVPSRAIRMMSESGSYAVHDSMMYRWFRLSITGHVIRARASLLRMWEEELRKAVHNLPGIRSAEDSFNTKYRS
jgi:hypothetical protein